ncbi:hypothetical protein R1flu_004394 [Riccia fluitans]|uniref:Ubiquitin-like protease family profile domain-containing protein n=1 Tax=Riccia fluitans TaxID=41844 RepID=A0ABD1YQ56_9MARC
MEGKGEGYRILAPSQIVPVPALMDLTQYASSLENEGLEDQSSMTRICKGTFQRGSSCLFMAKTIGHLPSSDFITMMLGWLLTWIVPKGHDPEAIFHILKQVLFLIVPIDPALVMMGIMNVEQQQDGHSCGKHILQMLAGAAMKELDGLDRCFREEGLRYIAILD